MASFIEDIFSDVAVMDHYGVGLNKFTSSHSLLSDLVVVQFYIFLCFPSFNLLNSTLLNVNDVLASLEFLQFKQALSVIKYYFSDKNLWNWWQKHLVLGKNINKIIKY